MCLVPSRRRHTIYWRTGVQTCALPISGGTEAVHVRRHVEPVGPDAELGVVRELVGHGQGVEVPAAGERVVGLDRKSVVQGKSVDLGGRRIIKKKTGNSS